VNFLKYHRIWRMKLARVYTLEKKALVYSLCNITFRSQMTLLSHNQRVDKLIWQKAASPTGHPLLLWIDSSDLDPI